MISGQIAMNAPDLTVREPSSHELPRALYLFQQHAPPQEARLYVAIRTRPVPRLVAAGAIWLPGKTAFFRTVCPPGVTRGTIADPLIAELENWARNNGAEAIRFADLLADDDEWSAVLKSREYFPFRSERFFQVRYDGAHRRVAMLIKKCETDIPERWRTEAIRKFSPEILVNLITLHRLLPVAELRQYWRADLPFGFDMDLSCILFDNQEPIGTFLVRRGSNALFVDVRVVLCQNPYLRALGNICLFRHVAERVMPDGSIHWLEFRGGEAEHLETANLAKRMGGREMPERRVWGRKF
jgi:hypothetical protein